MPNTSRRNIYICIDIEAALIRGQQYMIEIGAVKLFPDGTRETFSQLIKPYKFKKLNRHIQELTGITTEQLLDAPSFKEVILEFKQWCGKEHVFLTFGEFDRKVLEDELQRNFLKDHFIFPMIDFQQKFMIANHLKEQPSLGKLMEQLQLEVDTQHRALADADSLSRIFEAIDGEAVIDQQKTNKATFIFSSMKPGEQVYDVIVSSIKCDITPSGIIINDAETMIKQLPFIVQENERTNADGEKVITKVTKITPDSEISEVLKRIKNEVNEGVIITRNGMKSLSKILKLHSCTLPKTEVMTLLQIFKNEQKLIPFQVDPSNMHLYEAKLCSLIKRNERFIIKEFEKRSLFPMNIESVSVV